jgi:hypothetical protein
MLRLPTWCLLHLQLVGLQLVFGLTEKLGPIQRLAKFADGLMTRA